ncbi:hypothetical protein QC764_301255 [Podospora pseudoanserina]|uniref:Uncharacterized protein n=1 Tax=Podospora pseudoanserina TaxID=2609844 RepID=A0ABR0ICY2_9PEZI|nr:hypothetical protein QC764_301255 [Podospora pseudoanserina]
MSKYVSKTPHKASRKRPPQHPRRMFGLMRLRVHQCRPVQAAFAADDEIDDYPVDGDVFVRYFPSSMASSQEHGGFLCRPHTLGVCGHPQPAHGNGQFLETVHVPEKELAHPTDRVDVPAGASDHLACAAAVEGGGHEVNLKRLEHRAVVLPLLRLERRNRAGVPVLEDQLSRRNAATLRYLVKGVAPEPAHGDIQLSPQHVVPALLKVLKYAVYAQGMKSACCE